MGQVPVVDLELLLVDCTQGLELDVGRERTVVPVFEQRQELGRGFVGVVRFVGMEKKKKRSIGVVLRPLPLDPLETVMGRRAKALAADLLVSFESLVETKDRVHLPRAHEGRRGVAGVAQHFGDADDALVEPGLAAPAGAVVVG